MKRFFRIGVVVFLFVLCPCASPALAEEAAPMNPGKGTPSPEKPAEPAPEKSAEKPADEPADKPAEKPAPEKPPEKPAAEPAPKKPPSTPEVVFVPFKWKAKKEKKSLLVLQPRAFGYLWLSQTLRVSAPWARGSEISIHSDLDMERFVFLTPSVYVELNFRIFGLLARLHFSYTSIALHGLTLLGSDLRFGSVVFPAGTVVGSEFDHRRASVRYYQEVLDIDYLSLDAVVGGDYFYFRNEMDAPGVNRQEDRTEEALPVVGARTCLKPYKWGWAYAKLSGFYWNLGKTAGATGIFETTVGITIRFTEHWGFNLDFSLAWISIRKGRRSPVELDFVEFGPGLAVYAKL